MDGGGKELVNFSLGWGFFQTDNEVTNGWSVSQAQESYKRQREEEEALANKRQKPGDDQGTDGLDQGEWVGNNWQDASVCPEQEQELWESDLLGKCDMCEEPSGHLLGLEESNILRIREKVNCSRLCESHYTNLIQKYTFFQKSCCDPYQIHKKQMRNYLMVLTMDMYENNPKLLPGKKVCMKCFTRCSQESENAQPENLSGEEDIGAGGAGEGEEVGDGGDALDGQSQQSSIHPWSQEYQVSKGLDTVNQALSIMNISPVKKSQLTSSSGINNKLVKICDGIREHLNLGEVGQDSSDASELLQSLKSQYDRAVNRCEKYKILTSLPDTWTEYRIAKEFGCSNTMARDALKLRSIYGPGSDPGLKAGHKIPNEVASTVLEFFYAQDVSREMPGGLGVGTCTKTIDSRKKRLHCSQRRKNKNSQTKATPVDIKSEGSLRPTEVR